MSTNSDTAENQLKVVIDTNILVSAIAFGGKPAEVLLLVTQEKIQAVTSSVLLTELEEALIKILDLSEGNVQFALEEIKDEFRIVQPRIAIKASRDEDDNRVIEAALEGNCNYIITGDKDLLDLKTFKNIKIVTADQFLNTLE